MLSKSLLTFEVSAAVVAVKDVSSRIVEVLSKSLLAFEMSTAFVTVKSMSSRIVEVLSKSLLTFEVSATAVADIITPLKIILSLNSSDSAYSSFP